MAAVTHAGCSGVAHLVEATVRCAGGRNVWTLQDYESLAALGTAIGATGKLQVGHVSLPGYPATRLPGYPATRLPGYPATRSGSRNH
jgi:hypothetical protein